MIRKLILQLAIGFILVSGQYADAGMLMNSLKIVKEGIKLVKRQFPTAFETVLLKSGKTTVFAGKQVIKRNSTFTPPYPGCIWQDQCDPHVGRKITDRQRRG